MLRNNIYYSIKPFVPRRLQIIARRCFVNQKLTRCRDVWPIDESAKRPPERWSGWPGQKQFALILTHDVESAKGRDKCHELIRLEEDMGFRSSFGFVAEEYDLVPHMRQCLTDRGFELHVHGLSHDAKLYKSKKSFERQALRINRYLKEWGVAGFRSPSMYRNLEWIHDLQIEYDASSFDTDPFEPQPDGMRTIFPLFMGTNLHYGGYVELPYTLPQDFTLFVLMRQKNIDIWMQKLDWIARNGGMALVITHPDYMNFSGKNLGIDEYPAAYYKEFLEQIKKRYEGQYWHALPREIARFWSKNYGSASHE